uniref:choline-sulfatase n=1 Tax=Pararhizobium sp. IMCC3301 TaxID=3067904 RepID=UPI0027421578|nr:choline-sulfatase [Pararhizobium sp. IMCC3301]
MTRQPNILVIQADQLTALCLSAYGRPLAKTPNIDRLSEEGTVFSRAYCNYPVCGPSRASMMTGRLPSQIGAFDNGAPFGCHEPTYAHYLRRLGYDTTLIGKMHFVGPDQLHGFERRLTTDIYPSDFGWTADWRQTREPYSPSRMSLQGVVEAGTCVRSLQLDYDEQVFNSARQELFDHARRPDARPFLTHVSFTHPHNPFVITKEFWNLYEGVDIPDPEVEHIPVDARDPWSQRYAKTIREDEFEITPERLTRARRAYFAMVTYFDSLVGGLIDVLESTGALADTVVIITSDHGEMLGERGTWFKFLPFEPSVRVPLIVRGPGFRAGHSETALVSLVDLLPTFTDIASEGSFADFAAPRDGRSLFALPCAGSTNDHVFIEFTGEGVYAPALTLVQGSKKLVECRTDPPMMFDLDDDPGERRNIAGTGDSDEAAMRVVMRLRWDAERLDSAVRTSQEKRLDLQKAMKAGQFPTWDYAPPFDASRAFVRGAIDPNTTATKSQKRFPFVPPTPPQFPRSR